MSELVPEFETLENQLMRAWVHRNAREAKALLSSNFLCMFGTNPPVLLDRPSFVAGMEESFACEGYRFREVIAGKYGKGVWYSGHVELEMRLGRQEWRGHFLITDFWRKSPITRKWKLTQRSLAPVENDPKLSDAIRRLQLWR